MSSSPYAAAALESMRRSSRRAILLLPLPTLLLRVEEGGT
jgi:hypothetical protein